MLSIISLTIGKIYLRDKYIDLSNHDIIGTLTILYKKSIQNRKFLEKNIKEKYK